MALLAGAGLLGAAIDTGFLERPWPKERIRTFEVGRYAARWRQRLSKTEGLFAGVRVATPFPRQRVWELANEYQDLGHMTPGVTAVRYVEQTPTHDVIQIDVKILWKSFTLAFEVDKEPPAIVRFQLDNPTLGQYRGLCRFDEAGPGTEVELATWLKPARPVPLGLLLVVERATMLHGLKEFLRVCERSASLTP